MDHMNTLTEETARLQAAGYTENLAIHDNGRISNLKHDWSDEEVTVEEIIRFEGMSNPDDESMLLAVTGPNEVRGTLSLPYGPDLSGPQADTIRRLMTRHRS